MRRFLLLFLFLALILLAFLCIRHHAPAIEADIQSRASGALAEAGLATVAANVDGRDVVLEGTVATEALSLQAEEAARQVAGVGRIDNRLRISGTADAAGATSSPAIEPSAAAEPSGSEPTGAAAAVASMLDLTTTARGITLSGLVPDEATRSRWVSTAEAAFGEGRVLDRLEIDAASQPIDASSAEPLLSALAAAQAGVRASVDPSRIRLTGTVGSEDFKQAAETEVRNALPSAEIRNDIEIDLRQQELQAELDSILRGTTIEFRTSSAELTADGQQVLDRLIEPLKRASGYQVRIEGHTDSRGDAAMNLALSQARAQSVVDYLVARGIAASIINAQGFGEVRPIATNDTVAGRQRNRRIELRLVREN